MRPELLALACAVGLATWLFRFAPTKLSLAKTNPDGALRRFFAATGPAAIATLFTASILPMLSESAGPKLPLVLGTAAVLATFAVRRSVVLATLAGALAYGFGGLI